MFERLVGLLPHGERVLEKGDARRISRLVEKGDLEKAQELLDKRRGEIVEHKELLEKSRDSLTDALEDHRESVKEAEEKLKGHRVNLKAVMETSERGAIKKEIGAAKRELAHRKKGLEMLELLNRSKTIEQMTAKQKALIAKHDRMFDRLGMLDKWIRMESEHKAERLQHSKMLKAKKVPAVQRKRIMW